MTRMNNSVYNKWLRTVYSILAIPFIFVLSVSIYSYWTNTKVFYAGLEEKFRYELDNFQVVADTEGHICRNLTRIFTYSASAKELKHNTTEFLDVFDYEADIIIWRYPSEIYYCTFDHKSHPGNWAKVFEQKNVFLSRSWGNYSNFPEEIVNNLSKAFGPHFFPRLYRSVLMPRFSRLLRTDSAQNYPLTWLHFNDNAGMAVFFDHKLPQSNNGKLAYMSGFEQKSYYAGFIKNNTVFTKNNNLSTVIQNNKDEVKQPYKSLQKINNYYVMARSIDRDTTLFMAMNTSNTFYNKLGNTIYIASSYLIMGLLFLITSYQIMVKKKKYISIRVRLLLIFVFSALLPGILIHVFVSDYINQYRRNLVYQTYNEGLSYLQNIDDMFISEFSYQLKIQNKSIKQLKNDLKTLELQDAVLKYLSYQPPTPINFFLVSSDKSIIASNFEVISGNLISPYYGQQVSNQRIEINRSVRTLVRYVLALLNNRPVGTREGIEADYIASALFQVTARELLRDFQIYGPFIDWGLGLRTHSAFAELLDITDDGLFDYASVYIYRQSTLENEFIKRAFMNFNRNHLNMSIKPFDEYLNELIETGATDNPDLQHFFYRTTRDFVSTPEQIMIDGNKYMLVGHEGSILQYVNLAAIIPMQTKELAVTKKRNQFIALGFISLLFTISMGIMISKTITEPMVELKKGIAAMRDQKFSYRLPNLGKDEFGHMAKIFNTSLADHEEMQSASIISSKLSTLLNKPVSNGCYSFILNTANKSDFGGDCCEMIMPDKLNNALILIDAAGRGVSSIIVTAFVRSAVLQLSRLQLYPTKLISAIETMLSKTKLKKRAFASMIYLLAGEHGKFELINCGLPYPLVVDLNTKQTIEQKKAGKPLLWSKTVRQSSIFSLKPEQSVVCISSGFLCDGKISFDTITEIIKASANKDIKVFYDNFIENYLNLLTDNDVDKDLTVLIVKRNY